MKRIPRAESLGKDQDLVEYIRTSTAELLERPFGLLVFLVFRVPKRVEEMPLA